MEKDKEQKKLKEMTKAFQKLNIKRKEPDPDPIEEYDTDELIERANGLSPLLLRMDKRKKITKKKYKIKSNKIWQKKKEK